MKSKFYLVVVSENQIMVTRTYSSYEEAMNNKEFIERYDSNCKARLKVVVEE